MTWQKFQKVYRHVCDGLAELGIPFGEDEGCTVFFDDRWYSLANLQKFSFYQGGEITLCRNHVSGTVEEGAAILVHEITHYWCEVFPGAMKKGHAFRVPPKLCSWPVSDDIRYLLKTSLHTWLYEESDEKFLGAYSQVDSEECLADFMADLVVYNPDLRAVRARHAVARYKACREMLRRVRAAYAACARAA